MLLKSLVGGGRKFCGLHVSQWSRSKHHHALIIGPPGGGKGTLSKRIVNNFGFEALSSGDMIRNQIRQQTEIGNKFAALVNDGKLVPSDVIMQLVSTELEQRQDTNWMLDGFPRAIDQAHMLQEKYPIDFVIHIDVPVDVIVGRLSARWCHLPSGRIYNTDYNPPKVMVRSALCIGDYQRGKNSLSQLSTWPLCTNTVFSNARTGVR
eukprot:m.137568 g.137568  ORF g.137568 m.137568 type:complete len:207 (+) comp17583_c0_seq23:101-721(+)